MQSMPYTEIRIDTIVCNTCTLLYSCIYIQYHHYSIRWCEGEDYKYLHDQYEKRSGCFFWSECPQRFYRLLNSDIQLHPNPHLCYKSYRQYA